LTFNPLINFSPFFIILTLFSLIKMNDLDYTLSSRLLFTLVIHPFTSFLNHQPIFTYINVFSLNFSWFYRVRVVLGSSSSCAALFDFPYCSGVPWFLLKYLFQSIAD
jgi:hypothetical protein